MSRVAEQVTALIEPAVAALGYELLGVEYLPQGRHSLLRVYIDAEDGITLDDCERVSHQVSGILDVEDPIHGHYRLEVSSPGLDRPLFRPGHYARVLGRRVRLRLREPVAGRRRLAGRLERVEDDTVWVREDDGTVHEVPLARVDRANLVYEAPSAGDA